MLVDDHGAMIREAYRVLKPGSIAAFTVWGRRENTQMFEVATTAKNRILAAKGEPPLEESDEKSHFDFGRDID